MKNDAAARRQRHGVAKKSNRSAARVGGAAFFGAAAWRKMMPPFVTLWPTSTSDRPSLTYKEQNEPSRVECLTFSSHTVLDLCEYLYKLLNTFSLSARACLVYYCQGLAISSVVFKSTTY